MTATKTYSKPSDSPRWRKQWRVDNYHGIKRLVPTTAVEAHIRNLVDNHRVSHRAIAEAAGVSPFIVSDISRGIKKSLHRDTEKAILGVSFAAVLKRPNAEGFVPNVGGRRRIQALMAMGWRHQDLSPIAGLNTANIIHQRGEWFTKRKHDAIKRLYDQLWDKRGPATTLSINRIIKAGYAPPLAWDDDTIDDPNAEPDLGTKTPSERVEDVEFLVNDAISWDEIPARLGVDPRALERMLYRKGRGDLVTRAKTMPDRIAYSRAS